MTTKLESAAGVFKQGLLELNGMVAAAEKEVLGNAGAHPLIADNVNFFTKSFLISACAHLEMCVKELIFVVASDIDARLSIASVPSSTIEWRFSQKKKQDPLTVTTMVSIGMTKKEIDDLVSGNVFRTKDALAIVGVNLANDKAIWDSWKDLVQAIITRRNNIVHHNDDASDISLGDVRDFISTMIKYIDFIVDSCKLSLK